MTKHPQLDLFASGPVLVPTLADVILRLEAADLSPTRKRDCISAARRFCALTGQQPVRTPAILAEARRVLDELRSVPGISRKTWSNLRSNLLAAFEAAQVGSVLKTAKIPLRPAWAALRSEIPDRRTREGLSRFMRFCSHHGYRPRDVDDAVFAEFREALSTRTVVRNAATLERDVATLWNRLVTRDKTGDLRSLHLPSRRPASKRIALSELPDSFREDLTQYLVWAECPDLFAEACRARQLSPATVKLRREQVITAASALVASGTPPTQIRSLAALARPDAFKAILRQRGAAASAVCKSFDRDLGKALVAIAREWVRPEPQVLAELKRLLSKLGSDRSDLTDKNKALLRVLGDSALERRLIQLPDKLWRGVPRSRPSLRSLADAQAALAIAILSCVPLRVANLALLEFGESIILPRADAETWIEIPGQQMKNREPFRAVLPPDITRMLRVFRENYLVPVAGGSSYLFDTGSGRPKFKVTLSWLIQRTIRRHLGFHMTAHQFRHWAAKTMLDENPGAYELVRQLLGHKNLITTSRFYAGLDTARAVRHHTRLIEAKRAASVASPGRTAKPRSAVSV